MNKIVLTLALLLTLLTVPCAAETEMDDFYQQQLEASGATELLDVLPDQTRE